MTLAKKLLRSGSGLAAAHATVMLLTFGRNILLARLLAPEQFGIGVTYGITMGLLQASFEFAPDKYIIQAPDGGRPEVLGAAHTFALARGLLAGLVLFLAAGPIAALFHVPELAWAYQILAIVPIISGFIHYDFRRRQRELSYRQEIAITLAATAVDCFVALAIALIDRSHIAMLASVLAQVSMMVALSHFIAQAPYRLSAARADLAALFRFGWPLVLNSLIMIAAMQGDRALVGAAFGPEVLALYATAVILGGAPPRLASPVIGMMMLPVLSPLRGQPLFRTRYEQFGVIIALSVVSLTVPMAVLGAFLVPFIFGAAYRPDAVLLAAVAMVSGVSLMRAWTNVGALAVGNSKATLYTNCVRISGLCLAGLGVLAGGGLTLVAMAMVVGEVAALAFGLLRTHRINGLPVTTGISFIAPTLALMAITLACADWVHALGWQWGIAISIALQTLGVVVLVTLSPTTRSVVRGAFGALRP